MSDDLHGLVQHLGLAHFHVVATAAGGIGGLDYAVEHLERVRSLVVANSIGGAGPRIPGSAAPAPAAGNSAVANRVARTRALVPDTNPEGTRRWIEIEHGSRRGDPGARAAATAPHDVHAAGDHTRPCSYSSAKLTS